MRKICACEISFYLSNTLSSDSTATFYSVSEALFKHWGKKSLDPSIQSVMIHLMQKIKCMSTTVLYSNPKM